MKTLKYIFSFSLLLSVLLNCTDDNDNLDFLDTVVAPTEVTAVFKPTLDEDSGNLGLISITPNAIGATSYNINFGDGTQTLAQVKQGESVVHQYAELPEGEFYDVIIEAIGITGLKATGNKLLAVVYKAPEFSCDLNDGDIKIDNDKAISKEVDVTVTAKFGVSYEVYFGEPGKDEPETANNGEPVVYQYTEAGTYTIRVVAMSASSQTTECVFDFEVTAILQPIKSAPAQPNRQETDVISLYSSKYTDVAGTNFFPDWDQASQGSGWAEFDLNGDKMLQYINLSYQGIALAEGTSIDVSGMEYLHLDVWTASEGMKIETSLINNASGSVTEKPVWSDLNTGEWTSLDIPISEYTDQGLTVTEIFQLKFVGNPWAAGTVFIDNIYFYKPSSAPFNDGLLTNGDFEFGSDSWIVGTDDNSPVSVVTDSGNTYFSVNVAAAGNPWEVNMSQKVQILQDETYTLIFDAWSDTNRSIISGIGLSAGPWSSDVKTVNITPTRTRYSLTLVAAGFGAPDARVIFDLGAAAGMVNIDNVSLFLGDGPFDDGLLINGDFEAGSAPWIVGTDDNAPVSVVTDSGNTYFSVNVAAAGNPWEVNMSQKVEITQGLTYTLSFDAWSDTNRSIVAGIGLSGAPWSSSVETVSITPTRTTYTLTLSATDWGAVDARVIFDMGAAAGMVNIDNVSLTSN